MQKQNHLNPVKASYTELSFISMGFNFTWIGANISIFMMKKNRRNYRLTGEPTEPMRNKIFIKWISF